MTTKPKRTVVFQSVDKLLAYGGIALGTALALLMISLRLYQPLGLAATMLVVSVGYLILRKYLCEPAQESRGVPCPQAGTSLLVSLPVFTVFAVALVALIAIGVSADSLRRPWWVFLSMAIVPCAILIQANRLPRTKAVQQSILYQVVILAAMIVLTNVTVFPYNGGDTWAYLHDADVVTKSHTVEAISGAYRDYPLYPTLLSILSTLTGWGVADVARFLNVLIAVVCLVLLYSLAERYYHSYSEGLIVALVLLGSKWFVYWMTMVVSMTMTALLFCVLAVILFRRLYKRVDAKEVISLFLVSGIVPFFHPAGAVSAIILFAGFWVLQVFTTGRKRFNKQSPLIGLAFFIIVVTLTQWMYFGEFVFDRTARALASAILGDGDPLQLAASYRDVIVYTLDQLNFYCLLGFAGLGILRQIWLKLDKLGLYTGILGLLFIGFAYATQSISLLAVLPHRWFLFGTLLLVFPASSVFMRLFRSRNGWVRGIAVGIVMFYFLAGLGNTEVNRDRPFYGGEVTQRLELTSSEYAGLLRLQDIIHRKDVSVRVDFRLWDYLKFVPESDMVGYWEQIHLDGFNGIFPMRDVYFSRRLLVGDLVPALELEHLSLSQFYDSGDMQLLDRVDDIGVEK
jgi:hypothetical protein